jgi:response regulator of citrate/malate metabolism
MNILIVDDNEQVVGFISRVVKIIFPNHEIDCASNKKDALKLLQVKDYLFITLDGKLDGNNHGRDILKEMTLEQTQKTIVYSGDFDFLLECKKNEVSTISKNDDFMPKLRTILSARGVRI